MKFINIIHALEELVVQVVLWVILLPKTFVKVTSSPTWINEYLSKELEKDADDRFDSQVSPVIFWILIAVVPWTVFFTPKDFDLTKDSDSLYLFLIFIAGILIVQHLIFTVGIQISLRKPYTKSDLKATLFGQFYALAPFQLFLGVLMYIAAKNDQSDNKLLNGVIGFSVIILGVFWLIYESKRIRGLLKSKWIIAVLLTLIMFGSFFTVMYLILSPFK